MKNFFLVLIISACLIFSGCTVNKMASRIVDYMEADVLKKLENPEPDEEPKLNAQLADIYNAKAQFLMVNEPEKEEEAMAWLQQSVEICQKIIQQWPDAYANDKFVRTRVNLTMGGNMFLMGNQDETAHWCSYIQDVDCPQILKELQQ